MQATPGLVLTRREGERVIIGPKSKPLCIVKLVAIRGGRVRLAFQADKSVEINRDEVGGKAVRA